MHFLRKNLVLYFKQLFVIIGGRIHDIHASFLYQYSQVSTPMDIILVCGVNNIPTEDSSQDMIIQFESFIKTIKDHSIQHNHRYILLLGTYNF